MHHAAAYVGLHGERVALCQEGSREILRALGSAGDFCGWHLILGPAGR